jgi:hypothetical protein
MVGSIGHGSVVGTVFEHGVGKTNDGEGDKEGVEEHLEMFTCHCILSLGRD